MWGNRLTALLIYSTTYFPDLSRPGLRGPTFLRQDGGGVPIPLHPDPDPPGTPLSRQPGGLRTTIGSRCSSLGQGETETDPTVTPRLPTTSVTFFSNQPDPDQSVRQVPSDRGSVRNLQKEEEEEET